VAENRPKVSAIESPALLENELTKFSTMIPALARERRRVKESRGFMGSGVQGFIKQRKRKGSKGSENTGSKVNGLKGSKTEKRDQD
jgi:hypothetical protein